MSALTPEQRSEISLTNIDTSDCGVIAIQAVTGASRVDAVDMAVSGGYRSHVGTPRGGLEKVLKRAGYRVEPVDIDSGATPATFAVSNEYGVFLVYTDRHVMALVEGDLHNSRGSWREPIMEVTQVRRAGR